MWWHDIVKNYQIYTISSDNEWNSYPEYLKQEKMTSFTWNQKKYNLFVYKRFNLIFCSEIYNMWCCGDICTLLLSLTDKDWRVFEQ